MRFKILIKNDIARTRVHSISDKEIKWNLKVSYLKVTFNTVHMEFKTKAEQAHETENTVHFTLEMQDMSPCYFHQEMIVFLNLI